MVLLVLFVEFVILVWYRFAKLGRARELVFLVYFVVPAIASTYKAKRDG